MGDSVGSITDRAPSSAPPGLKLTCVPVKSAPGFSGLELPLAPTPRSRVGSTPPLLALNQGMTPSEENEQEGFEFLFAGAMQGIRNPRGHTVALADDLDTCLDHLSLASLLLRKLDDAGLC